MGDFTADSLPSAELQKKIFELASTPVEICNDLTIFMIDLFILHDDPAFSNAIHTALSELPELKFAGESTVLDPEFLNLLKGTAERPRMLIARLSLMKDFITKLREDAPDLYLLPTLDGLEPGQTWQELVSLNLLDILLETTSQGDFLEALTRSMQRAREYFEVNKEGGWKSENAVATSYVITVAGARGVSGKTVLATNLAAGLAKRSSSVLLLDFSLHPGDFAVFLDDVAKQNIVDLVSDGHGITAELLKSYVNTHPRLGFSYLASPNIYETDFARLDYDTAVAIVKASRAVFQFIVIDTGSPLVPPTLAAADTCDLLFLLTVRDVARLLSTQNYVRFLKRDRQIKNLKLIVNQSEVGAEISENEIESLVDHNIAAYLQSNPESVMFSINTGSPALIAKPTLPISVVIDKLADLCFHHWKKPPGGQSGSGPGKPPSGGEGSPVPKSPQSPTTLLGARSVAKTDFGRDF